MIIIFQSILTFMFAVLQPLNNLNIYVHLFHVIFDWLNVSLKDEDALLKF